MVEILRGLHVTQSRANHFLNGVIFRKKKPEIYTVITDFLVEFMCLFKKQHYRQSKVVGFPF